MVDPDAIVTYAQYKEDLTLLALFSDDPKKGFYVDVGANHPTRHSVTKLFYNRGWSGINIEPNPTQFKLLQESRKRDKNLNIGISDKAGHLQLRVYHSRDGLEGLSTFSNEMKQTYSEHVDEDNKNYSDVKIVTQRLDDILSKYASKPINFIKIDVEGYEYQVVESNDWKKFRPEVICIEANHILKDWRKILATNGYRLFIADGLNEYYIAKESWHRTQGFNDRASILNHNSVEYHHFVAWREDVKRLAQTERERDEILGKLRSIESQFASVAPLSLKDQPLRERAKRAAHGLGPDWLEFKRDARKESGK